jgi:hypothetical protein
MRWEHAGAQELGVRVCNCACHLQEICPENTLLTHAQLKSCIISHHTKALLKRDGGSDEQLRCFLQLEVRGPQEQTLLAARHRVLPCSNANVYWCGSYVAAAWAVSSVRPASDDLQ